MTEIGFDVSQTAEPMAGCGIVADQFLRHLVKARPSDVFIPYPVFGNYRHPGFAAATRPERAQCRRHPLQLDLDGVERGMGRARRHRTVSGLSGHRARQQFFLPEGFVGTCGATRSTT